MPAGRSNRAIPLGVRQRTSAASPALTRSCWSAWTLENKVHYWGQCRTCLSDTKHPFVWELKTDLKCVFMQHPLQICPQLKVNSSIFKPGLYVLVCKLFRLTKSFWVGPLDHLSCYPRHSCNVILLGHLDRQLCSHCYSSRLLKSV